MSQEEIIKILKNQKNREFSEKELNKIMGKDCHSSLRRLRNFNEVKFRLNGSRFIYRYKKEDR